MTRLLALLVAVLVGGCATTDQAKLEREVRDLVREGMPGADAIAALESRGFSCAQARLGAKNDQGLLTA